MWIKKLLDSPDIKSIDFIPNCSKFDACQFLTSLPNYYTFLLIST